MVKKDKVKKINPTPIRKKPLKKGKPTKKQNETQKNAVYTNI
jgi:hypothetical protein